MLSPNVFIGYVRSYSLFQYWHLSLAKQKAHTTNIYSLSVLMFTKVSSDPNILYAVLLNSGMEHQFSKSLIYKLPVTSSFWDTHIHKPQYDFLFGFGFSRGVVVLKKKFYFIFVVSTQYIIFQMTSRIT